MTKKFTEKQYNMLVEIQEDQYSDDLFFESKSYENSIAYTVAQKYDVLKWFIDTNDLGNEAVALMNPLTREWAHDKFVEEEKKFHFILKDTRDSKDGQYHLVKNGKGAIILYPFGGADKPAFKESEIIKWGFNSEAFDREEV